MKTNQKAVEDAVLFFARMYNQEDGYIALISAKTGLPELIRLIVYEMFLNGFNPYFSKDDEFEQHGIIHKYANELKKNGFVVFER